MGVWSTVHSFTAQIVDDTERPKETDASKSRRLCRLLLTIMTIIGLTSITAISLLNQPPKRSERVWIKQKDLQNITGYFDRMAMQLNSADWQCPCKATDVIASPKNKARIVEFYLIDARNQEKSVYVNSIEQFCSEVSSKEYFLGFNATCLTLLRASFQLSGWDFKAASSNLYMNSLKMGSLNPIAFMFDVCTSWAGGLSQATSFFLISHIGLKQEEAQRLNTFLQAIRILLNTCSKGASWPPPNNSVYLSEANKYSVGTDDNFGYVVAMRFNWTQYLTVCAPSYCEYLQNNSVVWTLFSASAQVGGFVSVILFALRSVVWPLICMIFGLSTCFDSCHGKENETEDK